MQCTPFLRNVIIRFNIIFPCTLNFLPFKFCNRTVRCVLRSPHIFTHNPVPAHLFEHSEACYIPRPSSRKYAVPAHLFEHSEACYISRPSSRITLCLHTCLNTPKRATFLAHLHGVQSFLRN